MQNVVYCGDMRRLCGDARFYMCADLIFADPPYNIGLDYGDTYRDNKSLEDFTNWLGQVIDSIVWCCRPNASIWIMMGEEYTDVLGNLLRSNGLVRRRLVVWYETFGTYLHNNFANCCRYLHYCTLSSSPKRFTFDSDSIKVSSHRQIAGDSRASPDGKIPDNLWTFPRVCGTHSGKRLGGPPNQLPQQLVDRAILACSKPGDVILDPFLGTGTTAYSCLSLGREFIGCEINPDYVSSFCKQFPQPVVTLSL